MTEDHVRRTPAPPRLGRRFWLPAVLGVAAVAVTGGVAMADEHEGDEHEGGHGRQQNVSQPSPQAPDVTSGAGSEQCLVLDKSAMKRIRQAEKKLKKSSSVVVKLDSARVVPCSAAGGDPSTGPQPPKSTSPKPPKPPKPVPSSGS